MYPGERLNSYTHLAGLALAGGGAVPLVETAAHQGDVWKLVSFSVFAATMVLLYGASTLYHSVRGASKAWLAKADHCAIFLLIAGTYTPFTLVTLRGPWGWTLFALVWLLALGGIVKELRKGPDTEPWVPLYLLMGWLGVAAAVPLAERLSSGGLAWLVGGGGLYSIGVVFYAKSEAWRHAHGIWHLFVLGGTACHYVAVLRFVG
ncbi:hemolysin III family protein [Aquabacterium sp. A7-Y]|uniref:PAQR family membrane homeostasis protein TrhA n=1 Tax=Aquabacterium sp. A7-Y TaxID=1349605 RepID=UPI00223E62C0|nr:hemolysin III family protein [Aquabacterium sp. A7-Y]MCW7541555.1 hemolysin III family protein [Aquabacterium sp. A7-Y]